MKKIFTFQPITTKLITSALSTLLIIILNSLQTVNAQHIKFVPVAKNSTCTYGFSPILYNNDIYFFGETKNSQAVYELGYFDGDSIRSINNPDTSHYTGFSLTSYNNNLYAGYFSYLNRSTSSLFEYNYTKGFKLFSIGFGAPNYVTAELDSNVFFSNGSGFEELMHDSLYDFPDNEPGLYLLSHALLFNNNIYGVQHVYDVSKTNLVRFVNGTYYDIPNPRNEYVEDYIDDQTFVPKLIDTTYKNQLPLLIGDSSNKMHFGLFNGDSITVIADPPNSLTLNRGGHAYNGKYYIQYKDSSKINHLAEYDGTTIRLINNSGATENLTDDALSYANKYNNKLYFPYMTADSITHLAQYDGSSLTLIPNPDNGKGYFVDYIGAYPIVFNNNLYITYIAEDDKNHLAEFNGSTIKIIPNPDTSKISYLSQGGTDGIVYKGKLYFAYADSSGIGQLAYLDESALATTLLKFSAVAQSNNALLNWQTASEINTSYFNIQRSNDGVHFTTINKTIAAGNGTSTKNYYYTDLNVTALNSDKMYYRLQEIDNDGKSTYSNIKVIDFKNNLFSISPNPAKDHINITSSGSINDAQIIITNVNGRTLYSFKHSFVNCEQFNVPISSFANQTLFITIITTNGKQQFKIVKE